MELRQLGNFLAVVECGSFGDAARKVGLSQPALSKSIQSLERSLGAPLFARSVAGTVPNTFGRAFEMHARVIVNEANRARSEIRELQGARRGLVTVGSTAMYTHGPLLPAILRFQRANPGVDVVVHDGTFDRLLPMLTAGECDFILCSLTERIEVHCALAWRVLMPRRRASIITSARNPLAARRHISPKDILDGPWLLGGASSVFRRRLTRLMAAENLPPPKPAIVFSSIGLAKEILREGSYVTLISDILVRHELDAGLLRRVDVPHLTIEDQSGALFRGGVPLMPAAVRLLDEVEAVCAELSEPAVPLPDTSLSPAY